MSQVFKTIQYIFMVLVSLGFMFVISGSETTTSSSSETSYIQTLPVNYYCAYGSPALNTRDGYANLEIIVEGVNSFDWSKKMSQNDPNINCNSNTNCCVQITTPKTGSYDVNVYYDVYPCSGYPYCERRYIKYTYNSNLECAYALFTITDPNPNGNGPTTYGNCP